MRFALAALPLGLAIMVSGCAAPPASQKFVVFFSEWSSALDEPANGTVAAAASWAQAHPSQTVTVSGFAGPDASAKASESLSASRAQVVSDSLVKLGVPAERIARASYGATGYTSAAVESRRVEIQIAQP
jgi:cytochrome c oxidase subunit 2